MCAAFAAGAATGAGFAGDAVSLALAVPSPATSPGCRGAVAAAVAVAPSTGGADAASSAGFFRNRRPRPRRWNELSIAAAEGTASPSCARAAGVTRNHNQTASDVSRDDRRRKNEKKIANVASLRARSGIDTVKRRYSYA